MVREIAVMVVLVTLGVFALAVEAQNNKGAEQIKLAGGTQGVVPFPHHRHQNALGDCLVCHNAFAQAKGSIAQAQAEGRLVKKQVMNAQCIQCHRDLKQAGKNAGPTICVKCHIKE
jgi:hypothetical protein